MCDTECYVKITSLASGQFQSKSPKVSGVGEGFTYTPIFEYQYNNKIFRVEHRISSFTPNCTYKVDDVVELRVYEDKPDKAIVNSKKNLIMPLVSGISSIILGIVFFVIYALFK